MSIENAYELVKERVFKFENEESFFLSSDYNETEVRQSFINPFFKALGWDVDSLNSKDVFSREVRVEKGQKQNESSSKKRADYAFYCAPDCKEGQEVFFVEAKKPSRVLNQNKDDYFQTANYGFYSRTGISILFDFQEFIIIDCRVKPDKAVILQHQIKYYNYKQFLDFGTFTEIYNIFSRDAVHKGNLQRYIESLPPPKISGKTRQIYLNFGFKKNIDNEFLNFIEQSRIDLAEAIFHCQPTLKGYELTEVVQKVLDRLVFFRFLEDKNIEPDSIIDAIWNSTSPWTKFVEESRRLDTKYNSGVFSKSFFDEPKFLARDNKLFKDIVIDYSTNESDYNFNYIPIEIIGNIYERFLGKTIEVEGKHLKIDYKPSVRKAGGVYYTPTYIVNYIVQNTVGKLIEGKTPKQISSLSFADISCGSGSFLIGIFEYLIKYHTLYYNAHRDQAIKDRCHYDEDDKFYYLTIEQKKAILLNNIYGVDLDRQATIVAQMSLLLKLLENETFFTTSRGKGAQTTMMVADKILPNLSENIKSGNSLIGSDYTFQTELNFDNDGELERKINVFDFEPSFPKVFKNGGFDVIVGNPPYVKEYTDREVFENIKRSRCNKYYQGKMDLWYFFVSYGIDLLKPNGLIGYIAPNNWVSNSGASLMRNKVITDSKIIELIDFGAFMVFQDASIQTMVMIFEKDTKTDDYTFHYKHYNVNNKITETQINQALTQDEDFVEILTPSIHRAKYANAFLKFGSDDKELILDKIKAKANFELDGKKEATQGIVGAPDNHFIIKESQLKNFTKKENSFLKKFYTGVNPITDEYIFYLSAKNFNPEKFDDYPNLKSHFEKNKTELIQAKIKYKTPNKPYYFLHRERVEKFFKLGDKIICPTRALSNTFLYTENEYYVSRACFVIKSDRINLKYLTGIFNSKLVYFWLDNRGKKLGNMFQIDKEPLLQIPIYKTEDKKLESKLIELVDKMIDLKQKHATTLSDNSKESIANQIKSTDYHIDKLVYELYGLTEDEIKIIEN